jgi:hypothetical protein
MIIIAAFAYRAVAPGVASIPMQWSASGAVNSSWPRAAAFGAIPLIAALTLVILDVAGVASADILVLVGLLFLVVQLLHIALTHRWFLKHG